MSNALNHTFRIILKYCCLLEEEERDECMNYLRDLKRKFKYSKTNEEEKINRKLYIKGIFKVLEDYPNLTKHLKENCEIILLEV